MTKQVQRRRGTATQHTSFTGAEGEISVNTTNKSIHVHDGVTAGGIEGARADMTNVSDGDLNSRLTGNTLSSLTITSADINGGTIDGTVIGGTTPAAGSFTTGSFTGNVSFGDNDKAIFGAGSDLQIYHDGSNSYVKDAGTGVLNVQGSSQVNIGGANGTIGVQFVEGANASLRHNNAVKLSTTSTGIDVTGTVTADGLTVDGDVLLNGDRDLHLVGSNPNAGTPFQYGEITLGDANTGQYNNHAKIVSKGNFANQTSLEFHTSDNNSSPLRMEISKIGDISFYEDTGTTPKFEWSASSERLTLSTSGAYALDVRASGTSSATMAQFSNVNGSDKAAIRLDANGDGELVLIDAGNNEDVVISSGGDTYFNGGNVGIGTSPDQALHVESSSSGASKIVGALVNPNSSVIGTGAQLWLSGTNATSRGTYVEGQVSDGGNGHALIFGTSASISSPTERMRIDSSGNVGIGTSSPSYKLVVSSGGASGIEFGPAYSGTANLVQHYSRSGGVYVDAVNDAAQHRFNISGTERMRIDASGNVGIGTISPSNGGVLGGKSLHVSAVGETAGVRVENTTATIGGYLVTASGNNSHVLFGTGAKPLIVYTDSAERMRIDSSGNLLVGKTSPAGVSTNGAEIRNDGTVVATKSGGISGYFGRTGNDGEIMRFYRDSTTVGSIGNSGGAAIDFGSGDAVLRFNSSVNAVYPVTAVSGSNSNGNTDLGFSTARFKDLYLSGGVYLGGTGAANKLDDYEEGQWEVVITGETSGSVSTGVNGNYVKVGNMVTAAVYVNATLDLTSISGVVNISLPLAALNWHGGGSLVYANNFLAGTAESDTYIGLRPLGARVRMMKGSSTSWLSPTDIETASGQKAFMMHVTFQV